MSNCSFCLVLVLANTTDDWLSSYVLFRFYFDSIPLDRISVSTNLDGAVFLLLGMYIMAAEKQVAMSVWETGGGGRVCKCMCV